MEFSARSRHCSKTQGGDCSLTFRVEVLEGCMAPSPRILDSMGTFERMGVIGRSIVTMGNSSDVANGTYSLMDRENKGFYTSNQMQNIILSGNSDMKGVRFVLFAKFFLGIVQLVHKYLKWVVAFLPIIFD